MTQREELARKIARAMVISEGGNPDAKLFVGYEVRFGTVVHSFVPAWREALPLAEVALATIEAEKAK